MNSKFYYLVFSVHKNTHLFDTRNVSLDFFTLFVLPTAFYEEDFFFEEDEYHHGVDLSIITVVYFSIIIYKISLALKRFVLIHHRHDIIGKHTIRKMFYAKDFQDKEIFNSRNVDDLARYTYLLFKEMGLLKEFKNKGKNAIEFMNEKGFLAKHGA